MKANARSMWQMMLLGLLVAAGGAVAQTPVGTAFTYQGRLTEGGSPANGLYDFEFRLLDNTEVQQGSTITIEDKEVVNGLFTVDLDFGQQFTGAERLLAISVRPGDSTDGYTALLPFQRIAPTPYAISAANLTLPYAGTYSTSSGTAFKVTHSGSSGYTIRGEATGDRTPALYGSATGSGCVGVHGVADTSATRAVQGTAEATGDVINYGGSFQAKGDKGYGVFASASSTTGVNYGVYGRSLSTFGTGVYGLGHASTGTNYGVYGKTNSTAGYAGYFQGRGYFSGAVGLGVLDPTAALDIAGTAKMTGFQLTTSPTAGYVLTSDANGVGTWSAPTGGGSSPWYVSGSNIYYNGGNVGIGVPVPLAPLHLGGGNWDLQTTEGDLRIGSALYRLKVGVATSGGGAGVARIRAQSGTGTAKLILGTDLSDTLAVSEDMVGVGTISPAEKLDVAGTVKMTGFKLGTSVTAGYVLTTDANGVGSWQAPPDTFSLPFAGSASNTTAAFSATNTHATSGAGVYGEGAQYGVKAQSSGTGVYGYSAAGTGIGGISNTGTGVFGQAASAGGTGVKAQSSSGPALYATGAGTSTANPAAYVANTNAGGIGIFSTVTSTDANTVIVNKGTGDLIKAFSGSTGGDLVFKVANNGTTSVSVLTITGGSDLAEKFDINGEAKPGMVVEIDPDNPGKMRISRGAYNRRVAGVISGANKVEAGMVLADLPGSSNSLPVALTGRVWVHCIADGKAIEPGDMLTTADRPGHAMPVLEHDRANGAVLGKAMSRLGKGETGMVLTLVNLQ